MPRVEWEDLAPEVRGAIQERTGPVFAVRSVSAGLNSEIAVVVEAITGKTFVKGRPIGRSAVTQRREAIINPYLRHVAPRLLWQVTDHGWDLLGFEYVPGRHADYAPGSSHLDLVVTALRRLSTTPCPDRPEVKHAEQRWCAYLDDPAAAELFAGDTLLHTDLNLVNILVHDGVAHIIDWAWPTRGAAFIDPACWIVRLIAAGHSPRSAEAWARRCPAYATAPDHAVALFALATYRMWAEIAQREPVPWKLSLAAAAREWLQFTEVARRLPVVSTI